MNQPIYISDSESDDVMIPKLEKILGVRTTKADRLQFLVKREECPENWELASTLTENRPEIREFICKNLADQYKSIETQTDEGGEIKFLQQKVSLAPVEDISITESSDIPAVITQVSSGFVYYKLTNGVAQSMPLSNFADIHPTILAEFFYTRYKTAAQAKNK